MMLLSRPRPPAAVPADDAGQPATAAKLARWARRRGATVMEYAVMLSFIIVVCFTAIQYVGGVTRTMQQNNAQQIPNGTTGS